jgi:hypothetical protein
MSKVAILLLMEDELVCNHPPHGRRVRVLIILLTENV